MRLGWNDADVAVIDADLGQSGAAVEQRSAAKVMRSLRARGLNLPRREPCGDISWTPPTAGAVRRMLKNPAYAGTFAYGRTRYTKSADGRTVMTRLPQNEWRVVEGPLSCLCRLANL